MTAGHGTTPPDVQQAGRRYEVSILIGPCSQEDAERAMLAAHEAADSVVPGPGTALSFWNEQDNEPGESVDAVEVLG